MARLTIHSPSLCIPESNGRTADSMVHTHWGTSSWHMNNIIQHAIALKPSRQS